MTLFLVRIIVFFLFAGGIHSKHVSKETGNCCANLGCFDLTDDFIDLFRRPINPLPDCSVGASFLLRTHENIDEPERMKLQNVSSDSNNGSLFRSDREGTKILVHGFVDSVKGHWMTLMEKKLLIHGDHNVITMDWRTENVFTYFQAASDARVLGALLANFIRDLVEKFGENPANIHIIGHSLGAHIAGYAGKLFRFGRITGLDPAGLYFADMPPSVRLDKGDADFVDTIITDGRDLLKLGYGTQQPFGHLNFYPNGGRDQPGCGDRCRYTLISNRMQLLNMFYTTALSQICGISTDQFQKGNCFSCAGDRCANMGLQLVLSERTLDRTPKSFYLITSNSSPYSKTIYRLSFGLMEHPVVELSGYVEVRLYDDTAATDWMKLSEGSLSIQSGRTISGIVGSSANIGKVKSLDMRWGYEYTFMTALEWFRSHSLWLIGTMELTKIGERPQVFVMDKDAEIPEHVSVTFSIAEPA